jgi:hypothetical protein
MGKEGNFFSTDKEAARVYLKQNGITQAPALLFLDTWGKLPRMALGELSEKEIQEKLGVWAIESRRREARLRTAELQ